MTTFQVYIPMHTVNGLNAREHFMTRSRRVKKEKRTVREYLWASMKPKPTFPCKVKLTRIAPSNGLDRDNLFGSMKGVRDAVAEWTGIDDRHEHIVAYDYAQERGPWGVMIEVSC